jgi:hypothetical protein
MVQILVNMSDIERVERLLKDYDRDARLFERFGAEVERLLKAIFEGFQHPNLFDHASFEGTR